MTEKPGFLNLEYMVQATGASNLCRLVHAVYFRDFDGALYEAPVGTWTDFASIPKILWGLPLFLIPDGWWALAAVLHDAAFKNVLYRIYPDGRREKAFPSLQDEQKCNNLMLSAMKCLKPNPTMFERIQARAIYTGVTLFGLHAFNQDRKA
jgi:hypothetical protein